MINAQAIYMDLFRAMGKDHPDKVIVARTVVRDNKTYLWHYWVSPDEVQPNDIVIANHHNLPKDHPQKYKILMYEEEAYNLLGGVPYYEEDMDVVREIRKNKDTPYGKWKSTMPATQEEALGDYTYESDAMNIYLRKDEIYNKDHPRDKLEKHRELMEEAISNFEIPEPITVYRVVGLHMLDTFIQAQSEGGIFKDSGFCSTAVVKGSFGNIHELQLVIHVPAGKGIGAWVAPLSEFPEENELLLNHGTLFEIHKITPETKNHGPIVELTVIGRDPSHP